MQQCGGPLVYADSLAHAQFGLSVTGLEQHVGSDNNLTLMGVSGGVGSNVLQPVMLDHTEGREELTSQASHQPGDKSPLPELTQLSSNSFRGEQSVESGEWPLMLSAQSWPTSATTCTMSKS